MQIEIIYVDYIGSDSFSTSLIDVKDDATIDEMLKIGRENAKDEKIVEMIASVSPYEVLFEAEEE